MTFVTGAAGVVLILLALGDVFFTVLVARYGKSLFSEQLFSLVWSLFRAVGRRLGSRRRSNYILMFAGPVALLLMLAMWVVLMQLGFALLYWPMLGTGIVSQSAQPTPTDFVSALYIATDCLTTAGNGDFAPMTRFARVVTSLNCVLGITTLTLAVTFLVQIYNALRERNSTALALHHSTAETGDAAEWLAGLSAGGTFEGGSADICRVVGQLATNFETYHFYSSLLYFHFTEVHYSQARVALIVMDAAALAQTLIDPDRHRNFVRHGSIQQLGRGGMHIARDLAKVYLPANAAQQNERTDDATMTAWRDRYLAARDRLAKADVTVIDDVEAGFACYAALRLKWDPYVRAFAAYLDEPTAVVFSADVQAIHRR